MHILDNPARIKRLDPGNNLGSVDLLTEQLQQTWREFKHVSIPASYKKVSNVVINAMGGSALPGHIMQTLYADTVKIPVQVINSYDVPACVNKNTLYLIVSYSGTTEEPLANIAAAEKKSAKLFGITAGGPLQHHIQSGRMPGYVFDPVANPSNQPRIGLGYTLAAHLALFNRLDFIAVSEKDFSSVVQTCEALTKQLGSSAPLAKNEAKKIAEKLTGKSVIFVGAEHLGGNLHVFANQVNETSKTFSAYHLISEMNHHLLEGLKYPTTNKKSMIFLFIDSPHYRTENKKRSIITKKVVSDNTIAHLTYTTKSKNKLLEVFEVLAFSSYVTFYLAMAHNINPNLIPYVNYFKAQLKKK